MEMKISGLAIILLHHLDQVIVLPQALISGGVSVEVGLILPWDSNSRSAERHAGLQGGYPTPLNITLTFSSCPNSNVSI